MVDFLLRWSGAVWDVLCEAGPYLILGLTIAGFLQVLLPAEKILRHLGGNDLRSVVKAALIGIPVPLCSCSVIPTAIQLRKSGASKGATSSFLISTPETDLDTLVITWALLDPVMTVVRPIAALATSIATGLGVNWLVKRGWDGEGKDASRVESVPHAHEHDHGHAHGHDHDHPELVIAAASPRPRRLRDTVRTAFGYAFGPLLDDVVGWLIAGFLLSGLILVVLPDHFFGGVLPSGWPTVLAMLVLGMPLYICASASTPIAAALIAKGLDPAAALVLLLVGPATNLATMGIVLEYLGKRVLAIYLTGIAACSLIAAAILAGIYARIGPMQLRGVTEDAGATLGALSIGGGVGLTVLLLRSVHRTKTLPRWIARIRAWCAPLGFDPWSPAARALLALVGIGAYASTAFTALAPGETAFVLRFGELRAQQAQPGLLVHAPFPFDRIETIRADEVRSATFGLDEERGRGAGNRAVESEVVAGDETILRITYAVHYRVSDARKFKFSVADPEAALRAASAIAARRMVAHRRSEDVLVGRREEMEREMLRIARDELGALDIGIEPLGVHLLYVHVPDRVHDAYLDVTSAFDDKEAAARDAEKYRAEHQARARARASAAEETARASESQILQKARGDAATFDAVRAAHALQPELDNQRRMRAAVVRALKRSSLVLLLARDVDLRLLDAEARSEDANASAPARFPGDMDDR